MIIFKKGNLFDSDCQTLVNTVNCYGVMGKGIALQFKQRFPEMFDTYRYICKNNTRENHLSHGGDIWIWDYVEMYKHKKILCFATKEMWQFPSRIEWIERGLANFVNNYKKWNIASNVVKRGIANLLQKAQLPAGCYSSLFSLIFTVFYI